MSRFFPTQLGQWFSFISLSSPTYLHGGPGARPHWEADDICITIQPFFWAGFFILTMPEPWRLHLILKCPPLHRILLSLEGGSFNLRAFKCCTIFSLHPHHATQKHNRFLVCPVFIFLGSFALTVSLLHHVYVVQFQTIITTSEENGSEQQLFDRSHFWKPLN